MPRCRKFKLIDAMILIAAAAGWMAISRTLWNQPGEAYAPISAHHWLHKVGMASRDGIPLYVYAGTVQTGLRNAVMMLAVAYVGISLIPPRLPESDLIRQPGMLSLGLLIGLVFLWRAFFPTAPPVGETHLIISLALGLSWGAACHRYRSRAEPGWIEGLGRSVGVGWVVYLANFYTLYLLI
jgi:hypothetical protein